MDINEARAKVMIALMGELYGLVDRTVEGAEEVAISELFLLTNGSAEKRGEQIMTAAEKLLETKRGKIYALASALVQLQSA